MGNGVPRDWEEGFGDEASSATSVHTKETSGQTIAQSVTPDTTRKNLKRWPDSSYRDQLLDEIPDLGLATRQMFGAYDAVYLGIKSEQFEKCRTVSWVVQDSENLTMSVRSNACRLRWCPLCADARSRVAARSCREFFVQEKEVRSVTLTMKHSDEPLEEQIKRIGKYRAALCRTVGWRKCVTGSVSFLQIKPIRGGDEWHPHYHMLVTGSYIPQKWLSEKWGAITGGSFVVDVRKVQDLDKALSDVVRYVGRPVNLLDVAWEHQIELVHATRRIRLCGTTGICAKGAISLRPPKKVDGGNIRSELGFDRLRVLACQGDEDARAVFKALGTGQPCDVEVVDRLWKKIAEIEGKFTGLSEVNRERGPPKSEQMVFETDYGFGSDGKW